MNCEYCGRFVFKKVHTCSDTPNRLGTHHKESAKQLLRDNHKGKHYSRKTEFKKGHHLNKGKRNSPSTEFTRERWKNLVFKESILSKVMPKMRKQTAEEKFLENFILKQNLPYRYVGNGKYFIEGKNPDYIHYKDKVCVELIRTKSFYRHRNYIEIRHQHFQRNGWKCIFIGTFEFSNMKKIIRKLK